MESAGLKRWIPDFENRDITSAVFLHFFKKKLFVR